MEKGLYLPDGSFMRFVEPAPTSKSLSTTLGGASEIAVRSSSLDYYAIGNMYLPNPDPVLKAQGKDIQVYSDLIIDDRVSGGMTNRFNASLALDWQIDKGKSSKSRQAKAIQAIFDKLPLNRIMGEILQARSFGYAPLEIIWGQRDGLTVPVDLVGKPQHWFVFGQLNELRFRSKEHMMDGEEIPSRKFLCPTNEATYINPYGLGLLSRCFWPVTFKKGGWRFWIKFSEKYGQVWPIGKLPRSSTPEMQNDMLDLLVNMINDGAGVIPDDGSVDFMESGTKGATSALYKDIIAEANSAISTIWLGHAGAGESVPGKLGGKDVAGDVRDDLRDSDKSLIEQTLNTLIDWICEVNWQSSVGAPRFSLWEEEEVDGAQAIRDKDLSESLQRSGLKLSKGYYLREYNLEESDLEDAPAPPPRPSPAGGGGLAPPSSGGRLGGGIFADDNPFPDQTALDVGIAALDPKALQGQLADTIKPVITALQQSGDVNEAMDALMAAYPQMDTAALEELLARTIFVSDCWGRINAER
jgi:phage gp29-like protein